MLLIHSAVAGSTARATPTAQSVHIALSNPTSFLFFCSRLNCGYMALACACQRAFRRARGSAMALWMAIGCVLENWGGGSAV